MKKVSHKKLYNFKLNKLHFLYLLNSRLRRVNSLKLKWLSQFTHNKYIAVITKINENARWANYSEKIKRSNKFLIGNLNKIKINETASYLKLKSMKSFKRYDFSIKRRFGFKRIFIFFRLDEKTDI